MQVVTTQESKVLQQAAYYRDVMGLSEEEYGRLVWPRRKLQIRRKGITRPEEAPIFPGYLFLEAEELRETMYHMMKRLAGFCRFLRDNHNIEPLSGQDAAMLIHLLNYGEVIDTSLVYFDANDRIQVVSGPLKGLEGLIVKVDKRKKRAKVKLTLYENSFPVDLSFQTIEKLAGVTS